MRTNYVLIDYENVQPESIAALDADCFKVLLFVGERQSKIPVEIAVVMQKMGDRGDYVRISGNGRNALDFHIAFYIGAISSKEPDAFFHIISKDTGFDPLIAHLKENKVSAYRLPEVSEISLLKKPTESTPQERATTVIEKMKAQASKPRTLKTLGNHINALFKKTLTQAEIDAVIGVLTKRRFVAVQENKVTYPS